MAELPAPMQVGDFYLAEILEELRGLRADIASARAPAEPDAGGIVELRGPKAKSKRARKKE